MKERGNSMSGLLKFKRDNIVTVYAVGTIILTLLAMILKTAAMLCLFETDTGYYTNSFLATLLNALLFAGGVFLLSPLKTVKQDAGISDGKQAELYVRVFSIFAMIAFFLGFWFVEAVDGDILSIIIKWSSFVSALFFAFNGLLYGKNKETQAFLGFGALAWGVCVVIDTYFDASWALNGPSKIDLHLAIVAILLFVINELRCLTGEIKKGFYLSSVTLAVFFGFSYALPSIIYRAARLTLKGSIFSWDVIVLAFSAYCAARLVSVTFLVNKQTEPDIIENNDTEQNI